MNAKSSRWYSLLLVLRTPAPHPGTDCNDSEVLVSGRGTVPRDGRVASEHARRLLQLRDTDRRPLRVHPARCALAHTRPADYFVVAEFVERLDLVAVH